MLKPAVAGSAMPMLCSFRYRNAFTRFHFYRLLPPDLIVATPGHSYQNLAGTTVSMPVIDTGRCKGHVSNIYSIISHRKKKTLSGKKFSVSRIIITNRKYRTACLQQRRADDFRLFLSHRLTRCQRRARGSHNTSS